MLRTGKRSANALGGTMRQIGINCLLGGGSAPHLIVRKTARVVEHTMPPTKKSSQPERGPIAKRIASELPPAIGAGTK